MERLPTPEERMNIILEDIQSKFLFIIESFQSFKQEVRQEFKDFRQENREEHEDFKRAMRKYGVNLTDHEERIETLEEKVL